MSGGLSESGGLLCVRRTVMWSFSWRIVMWSEDCMCLEDSCVSGGLSCGQRMVA